MLVDQPPVAANDLEPHHSHDALLSDLERKASATGHGKESRRVVACLPDQQETVRRSSRGRQHPWPYADRVEQDRHRLQPRDGGRQREVCARQMQQRRQLHLEEP